MRVVSNENRGPGPAREAGRLVARGEFIQYLDSDDLLVPEKFERQVEALRENPDCGVAYGRTRLIGPDGTVLHDPFKWTGERIETIFPKLLVDRWWCTHTPLYRRSVCDAVGPWTDLRWSQDWEYDGRVGALKTRLVWCDAHVSDHRQHEGVRQTSEADWTEPFRAATRKRFMGLMFEYGKRAGVTLDAPEMQHFSRWCFLIARRCGAAGMADDSREAFAWAREAAGETRGRGWDFRAYRLMAAVLGWRLTGRLFCARDRSARRGASDATLKQSWMTP